MSFSFINLENHLGDSPSASRYHGESHDSGVQDVDYDQPQAQHCQSTKLSSWQKQMLRPWFVQNLRTPSDTEMLGFLVLLQAPKEDIEAYIRHLLEKERSNNVQNPKSNRDTCDWATRAHGTREHPIFDHRPQQLSAESTISDERTPAMRGEESAPATDESCSQLDITSSEHSETKDVIPNAQSWPLLPHFDIASISMTDLIFQNLDTIQANEFDQGRASFNHPEIRSTSSNDLPVHVPSHTQLTGTLRTTKALRQLARKVIHDSIVSGCKQNGHRRAQTGIYACTIGCDYRTKRHPDLFRHEQIVYPQQLYFCPICGDPASPSENYLFTREDKLLKHINSFHQGIITTKQCEVTGVRAVFPERCLICLHHRDTSWKQRCEHIVWHYQSGDVFPPPVRGYDSEHDDKLWESSEEDDNDENKGGNKNEDGGTDCGDSANGDPSNDLDGNDKIDSGGWSGGDDGNDDFQISEWLTSEYWRVAKPDKTTSQLLRQEILEDGTRTERHAGDTYQPSQKSIAYEESDSKWGSSSRVMRRPLRTSLGHMGIPDAHDALAVYFHNVRRSYYDTHQKKPFVARSTQSGRGSSSRSALDLGEGGESTLPTSKMGTRWYPHTLAHDLIGFGARFDN